MLSFESRKQFESNRIKCSSTKILNSLAYYSVIKLFLRENKMELQLSSRHLFYYILFPSSHWRKRQHSSPFPLLPMKKSHSLCCSTHSGEHWRSGSFSDVSTGFGFFGQMYILPSISKESIAKNREICTATQRATQPHTAFFPGHSPQLLRLLKGRLAPSWERWSSVCAAAVRAARLTSLLFSRWKVDLQIPLSLRKTDPWKGLAWKGLTPWKLCLETLGDCYVYALAISVRDKLFSHRLKYLVVYLLFILKIDHGYIFLTQCSLITLCHIRDWRRMRLTGKQTWSLSLLLMWRILTLALSLWIIVFGENPPFFFPLLLFACLVCLFFSELFRKR